MVAELRVPDRRAPLMLSNEPMLGIVCLPRRQRKVLQVMNESAVGQVRTGADRGDCADSLSPPFAGRGLG